MRDIYTTNKHFINTANRITNKSLFCYFILIVSFMMLEICSSKQLILLPYLKTKNQKILLKMLHQTNELVNYDRIISNKSVTCISVIKNDLTKNAPQKIKAINYQIDFVKEQSLKRAKVTLHATSDQILAYKIDRLLDRAKGLCLYYTSYTFIYEYCHKQHMRQLDSQQTKRNNQKPHYQDISMGLFHPGRSKYKRYKQIPLTQIQKQIRIPEISNFYQAYEQLFIQDLNINQGALELQQSQDPNILHSSVHLSSTQAFVDMPVILSLDCQDSSFRRYINFAIMVTSYDLIYTKKNGECTRLINFQRLNTSAKYFDDSYPQPIRVIGQYLYGNVEERCTQNVAWQRDNQKQGHQYLQRGNVLFIELHNFKEKRYEHHYVTIKQVINSELIVLEAPLGRSFYRQKKDTLNFTGEIPKRFISNITKCQLFYRRPANFQIIASNNKYLGNNIMKFNDSVLGNSLSDRSVGCLCENLAQKKVDMEVRIGEHLWLNYYKVDISTNTNILFPKIFKDILFSQCVSTICYPFVQQNKKQSQNIQTKKFTKIVKLDNKNKVYKIKSVNGNQIFVVKIKNGAILKLYTVDSQGNSYVYLLSEGQIIKIRQFQNGTKQIIKQNRLYENQTQPVSEQQQNYIYIHASFLPNKTAYSMIWKYGDHNIFPRFTFFDQIMSSFQLEGGVAYIRIINTQKMRNKLSLAIFQYSKLVQKLYTSQIKQDQQPAEQKSLYTKSYSINYTYSSGDYCAQPINKFRKTIATIKCGKSWFQIVKIFQTSPCEYWVQIQSTILCRENYKEVVQSDQQIPNKRRDDQITYNGVMCLPKKGIFDEAYPYVYLGVQNEI